MIRRKVYRRNIWGSAELSSETGILAIRVFFSRRIQVCKKINTFLWVCQVFVLFFFVLWHLRPAGQRFIIFARPASRWQDVQAVCRLRCSRRYLPCGHSLELLEVLPVMVNKLLELREQCLVTRLQPEAFEIITDSSMAKRTWRTMVGAPHSPDTSKGRS